MMVKHYPNEKDRQTHKPAGLFRASLWSAAPGPGNKWVLPEHAVPSAGSLMIVTTRSGQTFYVGELPAGVTYA
jgi:hypothetical protein